MCDPKAAEARPMRRAARCRPFDVQPGATPVSFIGKQHRRPRHVRGGAAGALGHQCSRTAPVLQEAAAYSALRSPGDPRQISHYYSGWRKQQPVRALPQGRHVREDDVGRRRCCLIFALSGCVMRRAPQPGVVAVAARGGGGATPASFLGTEGPTTRNCNPHAIASTCLTWRHNYLPRQAWHLDVLTEGS